MRCCVVLSRLACFTTTGATQQEHARSQSLGRADLVFSFLIMPGMLALCIGDQHHEFDVDAAHV